MNASEYLPNDEVAIIGGGPAGMQTALALSERGFSVRIYEQKEQLGGHLKGWHHLFPHGVAASDLLGQLKEQVLARAVPLHLGQSVDRLQKVGAGWALWQGGRPLRSEEHTSELQSRPHLVCRLLLEKKKKKIEEML